VFESRNSGLGRYWSLAVFAQKFSPRTHSFSVLLMNSGLYLLPAVSRCARRVVRMGLYGPRLELVRATACRHRHAQVLVFGSLLLALVHKDRVRRRNHCKVSQTCAGSALE